MHITSMSLKFKLGLGSCSLRSINYAVWCLVLYFQEVCLEFVFRTAAIPYDPYHETSVNYELEENLIERY